MQLFDSRSNQLHPFHPLQERHVKMYVCGITPYDTTHLGHAFVYVFFDTLKRYLEFTGHTVEYTQNVTDIDDDILKRAKRDGKDWQELGQFWTDKFLHDIDTLHIVPPTHYVKATDSMDGIITMVKTLIGKNLAYEKDGKVYFDSQKFPTYGQLSKYSEDEMIALSRERGANPDDPNKKHPLDFILWQKSLVDEPSWDSPWGKGRPGWHIECSAMITDTLGDQIDIHGGGFDLIYPHHESEIAQSESTSGKHPFVKHWMHVAMLSYQGEKMSKSLGNLILVSDLLQKYSANAIRYLLLSHHYRVPWEFTFKELDERVKELAIIESALDNNMRPVALSSSEVKEIPLFKKFAEALENDMDTPQALRIMGETAISITQEREPNTHDQLVSLLHLQYAILGFTEVNSSH